MTFSNFLNKNVNCTKYVASIGVQVHTGLLKMRKVCKSVIRVLIKTSYK